MKTETLIVSYFICFMTPTIEKSSAMEVENFFGMVAFGNVRSYIRGCALIFETETILPDIDIENNLGILDFDIKKLRKSNVFPYGLTEDKIERLKAEGYCTVGRMHGSGFKKYSSYRGQDGGEDKECC